VPLSRALGDSSDRRDKEAMLSLPCPSITLRKVDQADLIGGVGTPNAPSARTRGSA
jgi:hypothetical protein